MVITLTSSVTSGKHSTGTTVPVVDGTVVPCGYGKADTTGTHYPVAESVYSACALRQHKGKLSAQQSIEMCLACQLPRCVHDYGTSVPVVDGTIVPVVDGTSVPVAGCGDVDTR